MRIDISYDLERSALLMKSLPNEEDNLSQFSGRSVYFSVPDGWNMSSTHPDLIALAAILSFHPFVGKSLELNVAISEGFSRTCSRFLPYKLVTAPSPSGVGVRPKGRYPGLAFSGGVDSTACLALLPTDTRLFFLDRVLAPTDNYGGGLYVKDSALVACDLAEQRGYQVHKLETNVELARTPVGFPVDWTSGVPAILLADHCDLSSISFGTVAESAYKVGHLRYRDFAAASGFYRWNALLQGVGLFLSLPVAGLSEVCTSYIVESSGMKDIAQSCIRGPKNQPCLNCFKCFRKVLLEAALGGRVLPGTLVDKLINFRGASKALGALPIKHENVLLWLHDKVEVAGHSVVWPVLRHRLSAMGTGVPWADKWYSKSLELVPVELRSSVETNIAKYVQPMSSEEAREFEEWDMADRLGDEALLSSVKALTNAVN